MAAVYPAVATSGKTSGARAAPSPPSPLRQFIGFAEALEAVLGRKVDLVERGAIEASRNYIRRRRILREAEPVYG